MNNDPIAEQLAYACAALRVQLQAAEASSDHWYKEAKELKKVIEELNKDQDTVRGELKESQTDVGRLQALLDAQV